MAIQVWMVKSALHMHQKMSVEKNMIKFFCFVLLFAQSPQTDHSQQIHEDKVQSHPPVAVELCQ